MTDWYCAYPPYCSPDDPCSDLCGRVKGAVKPNLCSECGCERIGRELEYRTCGDCGKRWSING